MDGSITSVPEEIIPRWSIDVTVTDADENRDSGTAESFPVRVTNGNQVEALVVTETDVSTGVFVGTITTVFSLASTSAANSGDDAVQARAGDQIIFAYADSLDAYGATVERSDTTGVIGGTDGSLRVTVVTQPGDTVRVRVTDADLNTDPGIQETTAVVGINGDTGESETIILTELGTDDAVFFGIVETTYGTAAGNDDDGAFNVQKRNQLEITYADTLLANGGTADVPDIGYAIDPFGDADANGQVQAFDAARVLYHVLSPFLTGLDSLAANVDLQAPFGPLTPYDASLILQKRVGLIDRFEVQEDEADNHPQPETDDSTPKPVTQERRLSLLAGDGYVSVWAASRDGILSGELLIQATPGTADIRGIPRVVEMGEGLAGFLAASRETTAGLGIAFAGARAEAGPGELLRVYGVGPGSAQLARAILNDGRLIARLEETPDSQLRRPAAFILHANVPNPFNPQTAIGFELAAEGPVELTVYDVLGQQVKVLVSGQWPAGKHQVKWDSRDEAGNPVASGVYVYRLRAGGLQQVRRMLLLR